MQGVYNITIQASIPYDLTSLVELLERAELEIYTRYISPDENLTVYLNGHYIGTLTDETSFEFDIDPSYVVVDGKNNLTFVYSGSDSARVDYAYLRIWDIFDNSEYAYYNIRKDIDDVYSDYEWLYYSYTFKPFGEIMLFDEEYGTSMYYVQFDLEGTLDGPGAGILNITSQKLVSLFPGNYYLNFVSMKFKVLNASYIKLNIYVEKIEVNSLSGSGFLYLDFNISMPETKYVLIQLSPERYHELSVLIVEGGNCSATVNALILDWQINLLRYLKVNSPADNMSYTEQIKFTNIVPLPTPQLYYRDLTGTRYFREPINFIFGERPLYKNNTFTKLEISPEIFSLAGNVLLSIDVTPLALWNGYALKPSENVKLFLSLNVREDVEKISVNDTITFNTNTTSGPTYKLFKLENASCGYLYTITATPEAYVEHSYVSIWALSTSVEDWYMFYSPPLYWYWYEPFVKEAVNTSAILNYMCVFDNPIYILVCVTQNPGEGDINGTSKITIEVRETRPGNYTLGNLETSYLNGLKVYQFNIIENYTYVITVEAGYDLSLTTLTFIDTGGNLPFNISETKAIIYFNPDVESKITLTITAKESSATYLILQGKGNINFQIKTIKSYKAGYEEGYKHGYRTGRNFGLLIGVPLGVAVGIALTYIIRRVKKSKEPKE